MICTSCLLELNDLIIKLDQRIEQYSVGKTKFKKKRIECPPRNNPAPFGLPQWMVRPCSECKCMLHTSVGSMLLCTSLVAMMDSQTIPDSQGNAFYIINKSKKVTSGIISVVTK